MGGIISLRVMEGKPSKYQPYLQLRPQPKAVRAFAGDAAAS